MCGLFGIHTNYMTETEASRVMGLGYFSMIRGVDSSGIAVAQHVNGRLRTRERKEVLPMHRFMIKDNIRHLITDHRTRVVMGHARAATIGCVNERNAHPIHEKHIIGTHNGTIDVFKPGKDEEDKLSDSRVLFRKIADEGLDEALKQASQRSGAYAIAYINLQDQTLNFARNGLRPLYIMKSKNPGVFYWASDDKMLELIAKGDEPDKFEKPFFVKLDTHYRIPIGAVGEIEERDIEALRVRTYSFRPGQETKSSSTTTHDTSKHKSSAVSGSVLIPIELTRHDPPWTCSWEEDLDNEFETEKIIDGILERKGLLERDKEQEIIMYKAGEHGYIDVDKARELLADGCAFCGVICDINDEVYWFTAEHSYVCSDCKSNEFVLQYGEIDKNRSRGKLVRKHMHEVICH